MLGVRCSSLQIRHPVSADYVAGRRRPYISPLRLCLIAFAFSSHEQSFPERLKLVDPTGFLARWAQARPAIRWEAPEINARLTARSHWLSECGTLVIFLLIAVLQKLIFFRQHRRYLEHAALALSVGAFYISLVAGDTALLRHVGCSGLRQCLGRQY